MRTHQPVLQRGVAVACLQGMGRPGAAWPLRTLLKSRGPALRLHRTRLD